MKASIIADGFVRGPIVSAEVQHLVQNLHHRGLSLVFKFFSSWNMYIWILVMPSILVCMKYIQLSTCLC